MSYVPYPMPPRMHGTVGNPGRQPTVLQAVGLIAGFALLIAVLVAFSISSAAAELAIVTGVAGLALGAIGCSLALHRHDATLR